ncbi:MAG: hypothetical protein E7609_04090 [Ruminococcaceae bacterium]|nr:hypothetical protein [Oscillospiraceae bacterium]
MLYVLAASVAIVLNLLYIAMFLEAILSWFMPEDRMIMVVLTAITSPIVLPVRMLLSRIPALARLPIDLSFFVAFLLLGVISSMLPALPLP